MAGSLLHIHAAISENTYDIFLKQNPDRTYEILDKSTVADTFREKVLPSLQHQANVEESLRKLGGRDIIVLRDDEARKASEIDSYLKKMHAEHHFTGTVLIKKGGKEFFLQSYGEGHTENTRYCIGSMGKMMTASAIMQMVQNGQLNLEDEINLRLPSEYRHPLFNGIKIKHLLSHTSGLSSYASSAKDNFRTRPYNFDDLYRITVLMLFIDKVIFDNGKKTFQPDVLVANYLPAEYRKQFEGITVDDLVSHEIGKGDKSEKYLKIDELYKFIMDNVEKLGGGLLFTPGEQESYSNSGYVLLGEILRYTSESKSYEEYMRKHIFQAYPEYQMTETDFSNSFNWPNTIQGSFPEANMQVHASKANAAGGSIFSTIRDMEKWDSLLYDERFLSKETKAEMFQPSHVTPEYGFGFYVKSEIQGKMVGHSGANVGFNSRMTRNIDTHDMFLVLENVDRGITGEEFDARNIVRGLQEIFYR